eukprot:CAMPEP_0204615736 /NCGR_PEP_ID=MMETSP0717-20131115/3149_1 /ASSEMBLY_ACC=CAM_ASM_000666 /TAXON_ID=230516 /ORGANISM="Chaetoceros curvisetus" /LENGTH=467 /DNA_ID=CAMNT_0051628751 /DNA_START=39 /DNA_END=1442 /DNA_ORIENTATION=-
MKPNNPKSSSTLPFILADIGEGIHEVEILQWYVKPGQTIAQFDNVCEVQSDKATVDITSRYDGVVDTLCSEVGGMIQVGTPLLYMKNEGDDSDCEDVDIIGANDVDVVDNTDDGKTTTSVSDCAVGKDDGTTTTSNADTDAEMSDTIVRNLATLATPAVRRIAMEHNLNLSSIQGTGKDGRVLKSDVLMELGLLQGSGTELKSSSPEVTTSAVKQQHADPHDNNKEEDQVVPLRGYNRIMVNSMTSTLAVPHMVYSDEIDMSSLKRCREELQSVMASTEGIIKLSYLPFAIKACSLALKQYPIMNSSIDVDKMTLTYHARHDIGIAIDSPKGLVVPVIRNCQHLSIVDIAMELARLRDLAGNGELEEHDLVGPTFTMSNIGSIGGTYMSPVVLPPQVAIGAMGKIQRLPRFVDGSSGSSSMEVKEAHLMSISWGGDHRVIDGGTLGRFSNVWKGYMEAPLTMITTMK